MKKIILVFWLSVISCQLFGQIQPKYQSSVSTSMHGEWFVTYPYFTTDKVIYLGSTMLSAYALGYANRIENKDKTDWKVVKYSAYGVMALSLYIDADIYRLDNAAIWKGISDGLLTSAMAYTFYDVGNGGDFSKPLFKGVLLLLGLFQNYIIYSLTN